MYRSNSFVRVPTKKYQLSASGGIHSSAVVSCSKALHASFRSVKALEAQRKHWKLREDRRAEAVDGESSHEAEARKCILAG